MFKSTDAGKTWTHIGLEATRQIGRVVVDPNDANRVYVAALGHIYAPNPERGVFRSTDGGATWKKILFNAERPERRRRGRYRHRSQESARHLRGAVGHAASAMVGVCAHQSARRRTVQIHRWRRYLEETDGRPAHRRLRGQHRHRHRAEQSEPSLGCGGRSGSGLPPARGRTSARARRTNPTPNRRGSLRFQRRRRDVETGQRREPALGTRLVLRTASRSIRSTPTAPTSSTPPPI